MRIQTFSILAGSEACNARCPFCISKMTPPLGVALQEPAVNWRNFRIACRLALQSGVTTAMLTGKGEPTLFPGQITRFLEELERFEFPLVELQTNGIPIMERHQELRRHLADWYRLGLTTVAVSIVHFDSDMNRRVYLPHRKQYIDLDALVRKLHDQGLSVRLACVLARGFVDDVQLLSRLIEFARTLGAEQLTVRPVNRPDTGRDEEAARWTDKHHLDRDARHRLRAHLQGSGTLLMTLVHGAEVYDVSGQNVCLTDSLTIAPGSEELRQLIFYPDGHLRYDWRYPGAILV